jgi:hypothetical protein
MRMSDDPLCFTFFKKTSKIFELTPFVPPLLKREGVRG